MSILLLAFFRNHAHHRGERVVMQPERVLCRLWFGTPQEAQAFTAAHSPHGAPAKVPRNVKTTRWPDYQVGEA